MQTSERISNVRTVEDISGVGEAMTKSSGIVLNVQNNMKERIIVILEKKGIRIQDELITWKRIKEECVAIDQDIVDMIQNRFTGDLLEVDMCETCTEYSPFRSCEGTSCPYPKKNDIIITSQDKEGK